MSSSRPRSRRVLPAVGAAAALAIAAAGCAPETTVEVTEELLVGTTATVPMLDPAGTFDYGSFLVQTQVFPFLMTTAPGGDEVQPEIAETAEFTSPTEFTVTLPADLTWANGSVLDSADVKFSFDRQRTIADARGPSPLLSNLATVEAPDATTVVFTLTTPDDEGFPEVLAGPAGVIVDDEVFAADALTPDADIVAADSFAGQYTITDLQPGSTVEFTADPAYRGALGAAATEVVVLQQYADSANLALDVQRGDIDVALRGIAPTDLATLREDTSLQVVDGALGGIDLLAFDLGTQLYGTTLDNANPAAALAVRQAAANLVDRDALAALSDGASEPLYTYLPEALTGAADPVRARFGDGEGAPDATAAALLLETAGVTTPVALTISYATGGDGSARDATYAALVEQLQADDLFAIELEPVAAVDFSASRAENRPGASQLTWFPPIPDAGAYLTPIFGDAATVLGPDYADEAVEALLVERKATGDVAARDLVADRAQDAIATTLAAIPLVQTRDAAVAARGVEGLVLDDSYRVRLATLTTG
ncbi:MAG: ABC transporter substrate-binding protein [Microbacteriaceae bacterium]